MSIGTTSGLKNLNNLAGGLASSAVSFAFTGNATFNILNLTDFGTRINGGLLELTVGKDGISSKIGNGGTNISYSNIKSSISGASSLHKNSQINKTEYDKQTKDALRSQWGFGDKTAKKQLDSIVNGDTILKLDADGSEVAQSINENGQKIIHLNSSQNDGFIDLGLTLQHEAHRDGIVSDEQSQQIETVNAVEAHTKMAINMANDGLYKTLMKDIISNNQNLKDDIYLYSVSQAYQNENIFSDYVSNMYDSSNDYWKLLDDGILQKDGSGWLRDERGNLILNKYGQMIGVTGEETGLLNIMYGGTSGKSYDSFEDYQKQDSYKLMAGMLNPYYDEGKEHTKENAKWDKTVIANLNMTDLMEFAGDTVALQVFTKYYDSTVDALYADFNGIDIGDVNIRGVTDNAKERFSTLLQAKTEFYESAGSFIDLSKNYYISGPFNSTYKKNYKNFNYRHYGLDLGREGGSGGDLIFAGLQGKITNENWNEANGNCIQIEYGFNFENTYIGTDIYGEYLHMQNISSYNIGDYVKPTSIIGTIGGTGYGQANYYADHLHYDIFTYNNNSHSPSTLNMLLGTNLGVTVNSMDNWKITYNPELYFNNWLDYKLPIK